MKQKFRMGIVALVFGAALIASSGSAQAQQSSAATQGDNTKVNKRDRSASSMTADNAGMNRSDSTIMREIRKAVIAEKSLSTDAHNVKIIAKHGAVTLKGPVRSEEEKSTVEAKAKEVVGADKVTSQISVVPKKS